MGINNEDFISTAIYLLAKRDGGKDATEADLRSSASRSYYAAFHFCTSVIPLEFAVPMHEIQRSKSSHQDTIDAITKWAQSKRPGHADAFVMARNLVRLKNLRKTADYKLHVDFSLAKARESLTFAKSTITRARSSVR